MKISFIKSVLLACILSAGVQLSSCKNKSRDTSTTTTNTTTTADTSTNTANTAPVEVANDNELQVGVKDATKDYPGVNASVENGEITLTGEIKRDRLPRLMMALSSLRPKKINNNLTVK